MFSITVSGNGILESETSAIINVYFSSLFINDDCILTLGPDNYLIKITLKVNFSIKKSDYL